MPFTIPKNGPTKLKGYVSNPELAGPEYLSQPSQNCLVRNDGIAESRLGYSAEFSIGVDGSPARPFYHSTYDIAFFALGTKVYYRDYNTNTTVDTGITLTTGTTTRFEEVFGDIILSNPTDGVYMIRCMRLNDAAANSGDSTVTIDVDGAARISVFGDIAAGGTADDLRIAGTNEQMTSLVVSTGVVTLTGTLSQSYSDNAVAIVVRAYGSLEKFSKILLWKSRIHGLGFPSASNADQPNNSVMAGQFVIGETGATGIEKIIDFTYGTGGSTKITVPGGGKVTNILGASDYIWFFTKTRTFATAAASITTGLNEATFSSAAIGLTIPDEKSFLHGCFNEDCAALMGEDAISAITSEKRIVNFPIDRDTGAPGPVQEDFDADIREDLKYMDADQTGAFAYYYKGGRQRIYQIKVSGQWKWFIFDHNIVRSQGSTFVRGAWQPPQKIIPVAGLFERNGVLYGTDKSDDTVYSFFTSFLDNTSPIYTIIATGEFDVGSAMMKTASCKGTITYSAEINMRCYTWNNTRGKSSPNPKIVYGNAYGYSEDESVGALPVGGAGSGETMSTAKWEKTFGVFPSEANRTQLVLTNESGGYIALSSYLLSGESYPGFSASI